MATFDFSNLKGDLYGGVTAGVVALPLALAFGVASGMGAIAGLYGAIAIGIVAAIFGGTPSQISGPTGPMTVVAATLVAGEIQKSGSLEAAIPIIILTFFAAGIFQLLFGVLKLGKYINYVPNPVVSGFMSGIGVIIVVLQVKDFFGGEISYGVPDTLLNLGTTVQNANWMGVILALATIATIYLFPRITKAVPSTLVALVGVTAVAWIFKLEVPIIGDIPTGLPKLKLDAFSGLNLDRLGGVLVPAMTLGALGMIDSLLTSVVADKMTKTRHRSNKELVGQGLGNMMAALIGGIPGAGATVRTVVNINSGGRTRISGIAHGLLLLLVLLIGAPVAAHIPLSVLAGILITVGIGIVDYSAIRKGKHMPSTDNFIMIVVLVLTVFWSLLFAVAIGLILASLFFMKKMADVVELESESTKVDRIIDQVIDSFQDSENFRKEVYVKNLKGPVFFGFASRFTNSIDNLPNIKAIIINMGSVPYVDQSGYFTFEEVVRNLENRKVKVLLAEVNDKIHKLFTGTGFIPELIEQEMIFSSVEEAIMWLHESGYIEGKQLSEDQVFIPHAFTPNGDGIRDEWELKNIQKYPGCVVQIFTREGKEIFNSVGYDQPWDGVFEGKIVPPDTYHYQIDLKKGDAVIKGEVTIFR